MEREPSTVRADADTGSRSPDEIRADIEETREELGETLDALAQKADVRSQAKARVEDAKQTAAERRDDLLGKARAATPESFDAGAAAAAAKDNAIPVAAGALVVGFLLGRVTKR